MVTSGSVGQTRSVAALVIAVVVAAAAAGVAWWLRSRRPDAPTQGQSWAVPTHVDRADFERPDAPWLVAVFSSATCLACGATLDKARALESSAVAVQDVEAVADKAVHERYGVEAVPMVLVADVEGVVRASFLGEPTATDLWAAVAEAREPGSTPGGCDHHGEATA